VICNPAGSHWAVQVSPTEVDEFFLEALVV